MSRQTRILVYRIGALGDSMVALPALWTLREHFANARLALLCDRHVGRRHVPAKAVFQGSGLFEEYVVYPVDRRPRIGPVLRPLRMLMLLARLRLKRFGTLVYLAPSMGLASRIRRDRRFFRLAGISKFIGMAGYPDLDDSHLSHPIAPLPREAKLLLDRLAASGIDVPAIDEARKDLALNRDDRQEMQGWLNELEPSGGRPWVGVGPGSKMPAKVWPEDRFEVVLRRLIERFDVWPVVFGGPEEKPLGDRLLGKLGRGYNAAGALGVRAAAAALERCRLYVGNDTGAMHLAASAGARCVAIFCARDFPGRWDPLGVGHVVLRKTVPCEGCAPDESCPRQNMACILSITTEEVLAACSRILREELGRGGPP